MKCISCETEINPKWKHAIDINVCPFCGEHIMEEHLKNCLSNLAVAMEDMLKYPDQLSDWLLSNHSFIKTDSPDIGKYMPAELLKQLKKVEEEKDFQARKDAPGKKEVIKIKNDSGVEEEVVVQKIQSDERTSEFFKRAEVIKNPNNSQTKQQLGPNAAPTYQSPAEKTEYLKKVKQQIEKVGAPALTSKEGGSMMLPAEMLANADPEAVAEFQQMIAGGGEVASSMDDSWDGDDDLPGGDGILQANRAIAASKQGGGSSGDYNPKDAAHLARLQDKVSNSRRNMKGGGGSFSRS
jgi:hypothetical protein